MRKVRIISDTACDLDPQMVEDLMIALVPLRVSFGEISYRSREDLSIEQFYEMIETSPHHPKTSAPTPEDLMSKFKEVLNEEPEEVQILSLSLSSKSSASFRTAQLAAETVDSDRLHLLDTNTLTIAHGLIVRHAALMANEGRSLEQITTWVENNKEKARCFAMLGTLKYLERGGRISKSKYWVGSILKFRPFISTVDGIVVDVARVRGGDAGMDLLKDVGERILAHPETTTMAVGYTTALEEAEELMQYLKDRCPGDKEMFFTRVGPTMGAHMGPGLFGFGWIGPPEQVFLEDNE